MTSPDVTRSTAGATLSEDRRLTAAAGQIGDGLPYLTIQSGPITVVVSGDPDVAVSEQVAAAARLARAVSTHLAQLRRYARRETAT